MKSGARDVIRFFATGFGAGRIRFAPGTWGTVVAIPIVLLLREAGWVAYTLVTLVMLGAGVWICECAERDYGADSPMIVWDEIVGFLITMFLVPSGWLWLVAAFMLFRLFDIAKPSPIGWLDRRLTGGWGVMLDDVLAGVFACVLLHVGNYFLG
jgi:phosphatidylglycerophosphatase A